MSPSTIERKICKRQLKHWKTLKEYRRTRCKNCERFLQQPKLRSGGERQKCRAGRLHSTRESKIPQYSRIRGRCYTNPPKQVILSILQIKKLLQMDTAQIRFHAVHRIDKRKGNKYRTIIARSVCREDRDKDFARKQGVKESKVRGRLYNRWLCKSYTRWTKEANEGDVLGKGARFRGQCGWQISVHRRNKVWCNKYPRGFWIDQLTNIDLFN